MVGLPLLLSGDTPQQPRIYITYTRENAVTGQVYSGRTSGAVDRPIQSILDIRAAGDPHPRLTQEGFGPMIVNTISDNYDATRGREQQLIDYAGGAQSVGGTSANKVNGIWDFNPSRPGYMAASNAEFGGPLPDNSPPRYRISDASDLGGSSFGGFLIYPNKPNNNFSSAIYRK